MTTSPQLFSPEELRENEHVRQGLINLLASGEGMFMAGAGCTATLFPPWAAFLGRLYTEAKEKDPEIPDFVSSGDDYLTYADRLKMALGKEDYYRLIYANFRSRGKGHERVHETICRFLHYKKVKAIITTNYDQVLESALNVVSENRAESVWIEDNIEKAMIFEFLLSLNDDQTARRIFHFHGICHQKDSIILSRSEYESKYGFRLQTPPGSIYDTIKDGGISQEQFTELMKDFAIEWTIHRKLLWSFFATRRLIFLGFSLDDPYFNKMLEFVKTDLHPHGYSIHYLILRVVTEADKTRAKDRSKYLKKNFGIETILYQENETNTGFENFIADLENAVIPGPPDRKIAGEEEKLEEKDEEKLDDGDEEVTKMLIEKNRRK